MENNPALMEKEKGVLKSSLNTLNLRPPGVILGEDGVSGEEKKSPPFSLLEGMEATFLQSSRKEETIESARGDPLLPPAPPKDELNPEESKKDSPSHQQEISFIDSFLIELIHNIKNALASIYHATVLSMDQYDNAETRKRSHAQVKEDIKKVDSVLNSVLNFININTPIIKTNTLYVILEEILEANEKPLRQKNIKIQQKYEKDLPDTFIHPEQVRFILHSVLQYAILSTPPDQTIGFLTRSTEIPSGGGADKHLGENRRRYVEVMIGFHGDGKPAHPKENLSETQEIQKEGMADLILKLAREILQKNHGMMVETHGKRSERLITLRFPIERRKVVYYEPIAI